MAAKGPLSKEQLERFFEDGYLVRSKRANEASERTNRASCLNTHRGNHTVLSNYSLAIGSRRVAQRRILFFGEAKRSSGVLIVNSLHQQSLSNSSTQSMICKAPKTTLQR